MKTPEELNALKTEVETLNIKLSELTEDELNEVTGGARYFICTSMGGSDPCTTPASERNYTSCPFCQKRNS